MPKFFRASWLTALGIVAGALTTGSVQATGPSFHCENASTKVEKMICASPQLSQMDLELAQAFHNALFHASSGQNKQIHQDQLAWVKQRNQCTTDSCLTSSYQQRLSALHSATSSTASSSATGGSQPVSTSDGNIQAECKGAAAGQYGVRPVYVTVGKVWPASDGYSIEGSVDKGKEGIKKFNCIYGKDRKLKTVMALTSDGE